MRLEGTLPAGNVKATSVQMTLETPSLNLTSHADIRTSQPQQVFCTLGLRVMRGPSPATMALVRPHYLPGMGLRALHATYWSAHSTLPLYQTTQRSNVYRGLMDSKSDPPITLENQRATLQECFGGTW